METDEYEIEKFIDQSQIAMQELVDAFVKNVPETYVAGKVQNVTKPVMFPDLKIVTKEKGLLSFKLNYTQRLYMELLLPGQKQDDLYINDLKGVRDMVLKGRQFGMSTFILGLYFIKTIGIPHTYTYIMAHDKSSTNTLFNTVKLFHEYLPPELRPVIGKSNEKELYFPQINSRFIVGTAGSGDIGRGGTVHNFLGSEVAMWDNPKDIISGVGQSVSRRSNIFLETTAKGVGNWYHTEWVKAIEGRSIYKPRFFSWLDVPDYQITYDDLRLDQFQNLRGFDPNNLDDEEIILRDKFKASDSKLMWRRYKIMELEREFKQEYPTTWQEAFLSSGDTYIDPKVLNRLQGEIVGNDGFAKKAWGGFSTWTPETQPKLMMAIKDKGVKIFRDPKPDETFFITADVAEGYTKDKKKDFSVADVWSKQDWEQVCSVHGQWTTTNFALMLVELGWFFNYALIVPERNNYGLAVINEIQHTTYGVGSSEHGLYMHYDDKPGWPTDVKSRVQALTSMETLLTDGSIKLNNSDTIAELFTFISVANGKAEAEKGCNDDRVTSLWIASSMLYSIGGKVINPVAGGQPKMQPVYRSSTPIIRTPIGIPNLIHPSRLN